MKYLKTHEEFSQEERNLSRKKEFDLLKTSAEKKEYTLNAMRNIIKEYFLTLNTDKLIFFNEADIESQNMPTCYYEPDELKKLRPVFCKFSNGQRSWVFAIIKGKFGGVFLDIFGMSRPISFDEIDDLESLNKIYFYIINITPEMVEDQMVKSETDKFNF